MFPCLPPSRPFFCKKEGGWGWDETLLALFTAETLVFVWNQHGFWSDLPVEFCSGAVD
jgi:hypothetical protein